jgi:hypothetical protein
LKARTTVAASMAALALAGVGCDSSEPKLEVGACTNQDPDDFISLDVKAVDCESDEAKSKVYEEADKSEDCELSSVSDRENDKVYCTEPYPPGSGPGRLRVGACTTAGTKGPDLNPLPVLIDCDHKNAKSKIVKRAKSEDECSRRAIRADNGDIWCIEPN